MVSERAQFTTPRWVPPLVIGTAVLVVVAEAVLDAQREAMTQCAPDCQLGGPVFAPGGLVDAALVVIPLLGIAFLSWLLFTSGVVPRRIGGERDE